MARQKVENKLEKVEKEPPKVEKRARRVENKSRKVELERPEVTVCWRAVIALTVKVENCLSFSTFEPVGKAAIPAWPIREPAGDAFV